ncbi:unnamed protein product [Brassicogethes aeneus]|uniref:Protein cortex n=1 Tax=Brassicogethes aeneus TaxID=1431903 RepID=A0A9P0BK20_BRAAE|nr:unnamed protein product [Brassicogethes aeneus]
MFGRKAIKSSSDRFIPTRAHMNLEISNYKLKNSDPGTESSETWPEDNTYFNLKKHNYNITKYRQHLCLALTLNQEKILNFSSPHCKKMGKVCQNDKLWPVYPRKKPLMEQPQLVLDMPELDVYLSSHVVDWSSTGYVATIYNKEVHLWHPEKMLRRQKTVTNKQVKKSVRWNKNGRYFAVAIGKSKCLIVDAQDLKNTFEILCLCSFEYKTCELRHIDISHNDTIVFGCSLGRISLYRSFSNDFHFNSQSRVAAFVSENLGNSVVSVELSCNDKFLAVSLMDGHIVVMTFPQLQTVAYYSNDRPIKSLCWHPWKENLLVVCSKKSLILFNINTMSKVAEKPFQHPNTIVDSMAFNPISGELVVSYFIYQQDHSKCTLRVLKNFDKVVDEIMVGVERVPYLLWDSTGTQLASGSAEENLCIWNFFGTKDERTNILKIGKASKKNLTINPKKTVFMLSKPIR